MTPEATFTPAPTTVPKIFPTVPKYPELGNQLPYDDELSLELGLYGSLPTEPNLSSFELELTYLNFGSVGIGFVYVEDISA